MLNFSWFLGVCGVAAIVKHYRRAYLAVVQTIRVVLGGLKGRWVVLLDRRRRAYLASV